MTLFLFKIRLKEIDVYNTVAQSKFPHIFYISDTSTFDAMTDAIEYAAVVVPVLTSAYQESVNCRKGMLYK